MKKIKIVHIITSLKCGGAEAFLCDLLTCMPKAHFEHHVIYFYPGQYVVTLQKAGISTHHILGLVSRYDPIFCVRFMRKLYVLKPDLVHTLLWSAHIMGSFSAMLFRIPIVHALHSHAEVAGFVDWSWTAWPKKAVTTWLLPKADSIVTVSAAIAQEARLYYRKRSHHKILTFTNGINVAHVRRLILENAVSRETFGCSKDEIVIGSVGRFVPLKNHNLLLEVFAQLISKVPNVRLVLVGYGHLEQQLRKRADQLRIARSVSFVIHQPAYRYYQQFDCFVLPSKSEGISIALLEAMACKLPCVLASVNGEHEVVASMKDGLVVQPTRGEMLSALELIVSDRVLREQLGSMAYRRVCNEFDIQTVSKNYVNMFKKIRHDYPQY